MGSEPSRANGCHALQHFYASTALHEGESIKALSKYLGHADPGVTLRTYTHLVEDSSQRTKRAIDTVFGHVPADDEPAELDQEDQENDENDDQALEDPDEDDDEDWHNVCRRIQAQTSWAEGVQRVLDPRDVTLTDGLPTMTMERTIADLIEEVGDLSLVADEVRDASRKRNLDLDRVRELLAPLAHRSGFKKGDGAALLDRLMEIAGIDPNAVTRRVAADTSLAATYFGSLSKADLIGSLSRQKCRTRSGRSESRQRSRGLSHPSSSTATSSRNSAEHGASRSATASRLHRKRSPRCAKHKA